VKQPVIVLSLLFAAGIASAQVLEVGASGGPSLLSNRTLVRAGDSLLDPGQIDLDNGFQLAFRMTLNTYRFMGHEVGYAYNRTNLLLVDQRTAYGMAAHQGFYDLLVYALPEGSKVRPFIAGGGQFTNFVFPGTSVSSGGGKMKFGLNYGFGVKTRVTEKWLVRVDFRQYATPKPDFDELGTTTPPQGWLRMNDISVGFAFTL
jgi:opacity protein-like surface antigen